MQFLHKAGEGRVVVTPEDITWFEAQGGQRVPQRLKGKTIEFHLMGAPWEMGDGTAYHGSYFTEDPDEIEFLLNHRLYGTRFIGIRDDGLLLSDENWIFQELEDGRVRCRLNDRIFKNKAGAESWKSTSNEYKELLEKHNQAKADKSEVVFDPVGSPDHYGELTT